MSDFEIMFFAGVAIFLGYKLYMVFGKTNGDEAARAAQQTSAWKEREKAVADAEKSKNNIIKLPTTKEEPKVEEVVPAYLKLDFDAAKAIDKDFSLAKFSAGAASAFELVIEGFASKKTEALQFLLSPEIYDSFSQELAKREAKGVVASSSVVSVKDPEIMDIEIKGNICQIVARLDSEQINFSTDKDGNLIEGSKTQIDHVSDIWTFERDLTSKKPNWTIVGIQAS